MTQAQQALIDRLTGVLDADPRVRSVWLYGSLGRGVGDAWSDVDLAVEIAEADRAACLADYRAGRPGLPESVLARAIFGRTVTAVTPDWERFDLVFVTPGELARMDGAALQPLLGDAARRPPPLAPASDATAPSRLVALIEEFLRVLGLSPVAVGRGEWLVMQQGVALLRGLLAAHAALARLFLARARPLAERLSVPWPQAFEDATRRHLRAALGLEI